MTCSHGWVLLFHDCIAGQLKTLREAAERAQRNDPKGFERNANVKLYRAISRLIIEVIPSDPGRDEYRQGGTLGSAYRHWRRAKIGRRFRLFFRYDSKSKTIVFAWVNDEQTLRSAGSKSDPYAQFKKMLDRGNPPDTWSQLVESSHPEWRDEEED
ncbi:MULTISPECIES: type II toxin-antitoxin system YhaV family toxin [unclassified Thioalkalivibrio]|uniref:type II toxin-antitoxin system YhaV family toxin n=1 Tax=unclassified Thioalkalivibrio TaxID=2621013 RepID=UPI00056F87D2|nr:MULTISPECIES: type II toxin-antitoxin system YhaV family toxin [unclassified Thioalkalivibrio]